MGKMESYRKNSLNTWIAEFLEKQDEPLTLKEILGGFNTAHIWNSITKHNVYSALRGGRISKFLLEEEPARFVDNDYFLRHGAYLRQNDELNKFMNDIQHEKELAQEKSKAEYYERLFERQFERTNENAVRYAALAEKLRKRNSNTDNLIKAFSVSFLLLTVAVIIAANVSPSGSNNVLNIFGVVSLYLFGVMYGAYNLCRVLFEHE